MTARPVGGDSPRNPPTGLQPAVRAVVTEGDLSRVVAHYSACDTVVLDVETGGAHAVDPRRNQVMWVGLAGGGRTDVIPLGFPNGAFAGVERPLLKSGLARLEQGLPLRESDYSKAVSKHVRLFGPAPEQLTPAEVFAALRPVFFAPGKTLVGHNLKFDALSIAKYYGGEIPTRDFADTIIASFLLNSTLGHRLGLDACVQRELGYEMVKGVGKNILAHAFDEVAQYLWRDCRYTGLLWGRLARRIERSGMGRLLRLEMDVLRVVCGMEQRGTLIDTRVLEELRDVMTVQLEQARSDAFKAAGRPFNVNSTQEKQQLLYGERGLSPVKLTDSGAKRVAGGHEPRPTDWSVADDALKPHEKDPLVDAILRVQEAQKLLSTYVVPYLGGEVERQYGKHTKVVRRDSLLVRGRVHTDFKQWGAETGRFSSRNPNLQNIPSRTEAGKKIRTAFVPDDGHVFVVADYGQIEPRIIASLTEDPVMLGAFGRGEDIYEALAAPLGLKRAAGKVGILAMSYGVGPDKFAEQLGIGLPKAKAVMRDLEREFAAVYKYKERLVQQVVGRRPHYVTTVLGRRRYITGLSGSSGERAAAQRQIFNTQIQGSAADIMKIALVRVGTTLPEGAHLLLTVHDEVVVTTPKDLADETAEAVREAMEGVSLPQITVPLVTDIKTVANWGDAK